jgi:hypothetical protein
MDNRQKVINNIIEVLLNDLKVDVKTVTIEFSTSKFSSKKESIWHIILNGKKLSRKDSYTFKYKCVTCSSIESTGTTQFMRKINSESICCYNCRNKNETKRLKQSEFMQSNCFASSIKNDTEVKQKEIEKTSIELRNESVLSFNLKDDNFKDNYFHFHLNNTEYNTISKKIISFQNDKFSDIENYEFWPIFKSSNQMEFTSVLYDKTNKCIFKANEPKIKCENCNEIWKAKSLERFKNNVKVLCKDCSLVNKTFKIRTTQNVNKQQILYQSKLELKFINWCNQNNINVVNGPKIPYVFNNKNRKYKVDFQIQKTLIEIKDNHIWHKKDLESGKWKAKEDAVFELIKNKEYNDYYLINPNNWDEYLNKINKI